MNSIDKNIFNSYETVETALLNDLATEVKTKGKKARALKGEGYYVKYDGVQYDITAEQCRIHKLLKNNYDMFVEQLNSAKSDVLGFWKMAWGEKLPNVIADLVRGVAICQKYLDAFKAYITEEDEEETETEETETEENEPVDIRNIVSQLGEGAELNFQPRSFKEAQNQEHPTAPHGGSSCTTKYSS